MYVDLPMVEVVLQQSMILGAKEASVLIGSFRSLLWSWLIGSERTE
jgi:hypothetical protein